MSALVVRTFTPAPGVEFNIRVVMVEGAPWFVAADVCRAIGLPAHNGGFEHHLRKLGADERNKAPLPDTGANGRGGLRVNVAVNLISESGLYKLIMRSDKPEARKFQDWVTRDVLPIIRRTGSYVMGEEKLNDPDLTADDLDALNDKLLSLHKRRGELLERRLAEAMALHRRDHAPALRRLNSCQSGLNACQLRRPAPATGQLDPTIGGHDDPQRPPPVAPVNLKGLLHLLMVRHASDGEAVGAAGAPRHDDGVLGKREGGRDGRGWEQHAGVHWLA